LTVPTGSSQRSAISRTDRPWKCASRIICRCSGVRRSSAAATCQPSIARSIELSTAARSSPGSDGASAGRADARRRTSMIAWRAIWYSHVRTLPRDGS
jgi:hypothetical protein